MHFFDYIFFRIYLFYSIKENELPIVTGIYFVTILQLTFVFFLWVLINIFTGGYLSNENENIEEEFLWIGYGGIWLTLFIVALVRYAGKAKIKRLISKFEMHKANKSIKTWQIFILPLLLLLFTFSIIVVFVKLK